MTIKARPYSDELAPRWDLFVGGESRNGGLFHERQFLDYHPKGRFSEASLVFERAGEVVGVLPAARQQKEGGEAIVSHPGSTAGGLVFHRSEGAEQVLEMLEAAIAHYRESGAQSLELRLAEPIFSDPSEGELPYLLWHRGFRLAGRELSSCVHLRDENWDSLCRGRNLAYARSFRKQGGESYRAEQAEEVYPVLRDNLDGRYGKAPTHTLEELADLKRRYPERLQLWGARIDGVTIGTVVVFVVNRVAVHAFYIAQDYRFNSHRPLPMLFHDAISYYREQGFAWFNFGISSREDWIKWGILQFKEQMGGRGTCRDTWVLDDLGNYRAYAPKERGHDH